MSVEQMSKAEYERPTSGKHFSRIVAQDTSDLTKNYNRGKHVDSLMKKLAEYMAQEGTEFDLSKVDMSSVGAMTELPETKIIPSPAPKVSKPKSVN